MSELWGLIMAGGRGARFWPRSRRAQPKQCLSFDGGTSLLRRTVERLTPLIPPERLLVVTGPDMEEAVRAELVAVPPSNVLVEPSGRNTAPCIGWGAVEVGRRGGSGAIMAVVPSDHHIEDEAALRSVLAAAAEAARNTNALITLGLRPTRAETGYGYLEVGSPVGDWGGHAFRMVERFREKPNEETAREYLSGGKHLWNAGMFVFSVGSVRDAFRHFLPATAVVLEELQRRPGRLAELWPETDRISIDYGIMERSLHLLTVPCDLGWTDLGSWDSAGELLPEVEGGRGVADAVVALDSSGNVVHAAGKTVALLGVDNLVVVDTGDALLVMRRGRGQQVRQLLDRLEAEGHDALT